MSTAHCIRTRDGTATDRRAPLGLVDCAWSCSPTCDHTDLFDASYRRANRLNSTKILRCFPHCCPRHIPRSYCGASLGVRVTCSSAETFTPDELILFARFRVSQSDYEGSEPTAMAIGTRVRLDTITRSLQSATNTNGEWIESRLVHHDTVTDSWSFELNPSRRWYYGWRSGKMNAQRYSMHLLEAVVFAVDSGGHAALAVASTTSPPFTITSFRRCARIEPLDRSERDLIANEAALLRADPVARRETGPAMVPMRATPVRHRPRRFEDVNPPIPVDLIDRRSPSDHTAFGATIGALFASLEQIPLESCSSLIPSWIDHRVASTDPNKVNTVAANFAYWLLNDPQLHSILDDMATQAAADVLDLNALRHHFDRWTQWLYEASERFLFASGSSLQAVGAASARLLGVADVDQFQCSHLFDWENFVARVRLVAVSNSRQQRRRRSMTSPGTISGRGDHVNLSVAPAFVFWQQLSSIRLHFDPQTHTLEIQAKRSSSQITRLVLDERLRSFNVLPHGESALCAGAIAGGQCFGDYLGTATDQGAMRIVSYSWPTEVWTRSHASPFRHSYRWEWRLSPAEKDVLEVSVRIAIGSIDSDQLEDFACKRVQDRIELVKTWQDVYVVRNGYHRRPEWM